MSGQMAQERVARAGLAGASEPGDPAVAERVRSLGAVEVWRRLCERRPERASPARAERDLEALARLGGRLLVPGDEEWPAPVDALAVADYDDREVLREPLALWVRGPLALHQAAERAVAVVGSRAATDYGLHMAAELSAGLAERGWTVVSGGAYGIDGTAHRAALAVAGPTVAVLAGGPDGFYPRGHDALLRRVLAEGAVVSELPPGAVPLRARFLRRNRLIAALARGTLLVEAGWRSGALNTLRHTRALGRERLCVPGPVTSLLSAGCHREIRERGAHLVTRVQEVLEILGPMGETLPGSPALPAGPRDGLAAEVTCLLEAVPARRPASLDRIAGDAGVDPVRALRMLSHLDTAGLVESRGGGWCLTELGRRPAAG